MKKQLGYSLIEFISAITLLSIVSLTTFLKKEQPSNNDLFFISKAEQQIRSVTNITFSKAIIEAKSENDKSFVNGIATVFGYPAAADNGIISAIKLDDFTSHTFVDNNKNQSVAIIPKGYHFTEDFNSSCKIIYTAPKNKDNKPEVQVYTNGCK